MRFVRRLIRTVLIASERFGLSKCSRVTKPVTGPAQWYHNTLIDSLVPQFVKIGRNFVSGPNSVIIAHDASYLLFTGQYRVEPVEISDDVFLGAGAIVLPGVRIGRRVVVGAGSVVTKDIPDNCVVAGNPARVIGTVEEYIKKAGQRGVLYVPPYSMEDVRMQSGIISQKQIDEFQKNVIAEYHQRNPGVRDWIK